MHLYLGTNGRVAAIDPKNGRIAWETKLPEIPTGYRVVTVMEHDGRVFAGCRGYLFALDAATGKILWTNRLKGFGYHPFSLAVAGRSVQVVPTYRDS